MKAYEEDEMKAKKGLAETLRSSAPSEVVDPTLEEEEIETAPIAKPSSLLDINLNPESEEEAHKDNAAIVKKAFDDREDNTSVSQAMDHYKSIKPKSLSPLDESKYDEQIDNLEDIYRLGRKSEHRKEVNTIVAQSLIELAGSVFAYNKGLNTGETKFRTPDFSARIASLKEDMERGTTGVNARRQSARDARTEEQSRLDAQFDRDRADAKQDIDYVKSERDSTFTRRMNLADSLSTRGKAIKEASDRQAERVQAQSNANRTFDANKERDRLDNIHRDRVQTENERNNEVSEEAAKLAVIEDAKRAEADEAHRGRVQTEEERKNRKKEAIDKAKASILKKKEMKAKAKAIKEDPDLHTIDIQMGKTQQSFNAIKDAMDKGDKTYGLYQGSWFEKKRNEMFGGTDQLNRQNAADQLRLDVQMLNSAKTKGAITEMEMELFGRPLPSLNSPDGVWMKFFHDNMVIMERIQYRITNEVSALEDRQWSSDFAQDKFSYKKNPNMFRYGHGKAKEKKQSRSERLKYLRDKHKGGKK